MFNVFICDDSKLDIENIKNCLSVFSKKKHVDFNISEFSNPEMLMYEVEDGKIADIFILDVEMPEITGIELAKKIRMLGDKNVRIVFVSHYPEYMQDSFDVQAFYYLSKPLNYNDFCIIIKKLIKSIEDSVIHKIIIPTNTH